MSKKNSKQIQNSSSKIQSDVAQERINYDMDGAVIDNSSSVDTLQKSLTDSAEIKKVSSLFQKSLVVDKKKLIISGPGKNSGSGLSANVNTNGLHGAPNSMNVANDNARRLSYISVRQSGATASSSTILSSSSLSNTTDSDKENKDLKREQLPSVYKKHIPSRYSEPRPRTCKQTFLRIFLCLFFLAGGGIGTYFLVDYLIHKNDGSTSGKTLIPGTTNDYASKPQLPVKTVLDNESIYKNYLETPKSLLVWDATSKKNVKDMSSIEVLYYNYNNSGDYLESFIQKHRFTEVLFYTGCGEWDSEAWNSKWIPGGDGLADLIKNVRLSNPAVKIGVLTYFNDDKNELSATDIRKIPPYVEALKTTFIQNGAFLDSVFLDLQPTSSDLLSLVLEAYATMSKEIKRQITPSVNGNKSISLIGEITQFEYGSSWFLAVDTSITAATKPVFSYLFEEMVNDYYIAEKSKNDSDDKNDDSGSDDGTGDTTKKANSAIISVQFVRALSILIDELLVAEMKNDGANTDKSSKGNTNNSSDNHNSVLIRNNKNSVSVNTVNSINSALNKSKLYRRAISNSEFFTNNLSNYNTFFETVNQFHGAYFPDQPIRGYVNTQRMGKVFYDKKSEALHSLAEFQSKYRTSKLGPIVVSSYKEYHISLYNIEPLYGDKEYLVNLYYYSEK